MRVLFFSLILVANTTDCIQKDSLSSIRVLLKQFSTIDDVRVDIVGPFIVSFLVLLLCSLIKYGVKDKIKIEWGQWALEFPIDIAAMLLPLFATLFLPLNYLLLSLIVGSMLIVFFCSVIRRRAIGLIDAGHYWKSLGWGVVSYFLVSSWIIVLIYVIF